MAASKYTLTIGIVLLFLGGMSLVPGLMEAPRPSDPTLMWEASYGRLFGIFAFNIFHTFLYFILGFWAVLASRETELAKKFSRFAAVFFGVAVILGLIPIFNTFFGIVPLFGANLFLHLALALSAAYFGFSTIRRNVTATPRV